MGWGKEKIWVRKMTDMADAQLYFARERKRGGIKHPEGHSFSLKRLKKTLYTLYRGSRFKSFKGEILRKIFCRKIQDLNNASLKNRPDQAGKAAVRKLREFQAGRAFKGVFSAVETSHKGHFAVLL